MSGKVRAGRLRSAHAPHTRGAAFLIPPLASDTIESDPLRWHALPQVLGGISMPISMKGCAWRVGGLSALLIAVGVLLTCAPPPSYVSGDCGNGRVDQGEQCDYAITKGQPGACPDLQDCNDGDPCTVDRVTAGGTCNAAC